MSAQISVERRNELWEQSQVNGRTDDDLYGKLLDEEQSRLDRIAQRNGQQSREEEQFYAIHPAAVAIRNEVYDAALSELCDPDVLSDPDQANRLATAIADRALQYLTSKRLEMPVTDAFRWCTVHDREELRFEAESHERAEWQP